MNPRIIFSILAFTSTLLFTESSGRGAVSKSQRGRHVKSVHKARSISSENAVEEPLVDDKVEGNGGEVPPPEPEPEGEAGGDKKKILVFRLSNRLAVAVCDTYDTYMRTGIPHKGQISFNQTVQQVQSTVPAGTCQSFKLRRCEDDKGTDCGWKKVETCS